MTNLLLILFVLAPLVNFLVLFIKKEGGFCDQKFAFLSSKILAIISFILLFGIYKNSPINFELIKVVPQISFQFLIDKHAIKYLFLTNAIWIFSLFYFSEALFFNLSQSSSRKSNSNISLGDLNFITLLPITIFFINIIIISANLNSIFTCVSLFYLVFIIICQKFIIKNNKNKGAKIFLFAFILELLAFSFLAIFLIFLPSQYGFVENGSQISINNFETMVLIFLLLFFCFSPSLIALILGNKNNMAHKNSQIFLLVLFFYLILKIFLFIKIITQIFSVGLFSTILPQYIDIFIEIILGTIILYGLFCLLFSQNFLEIFILLLINQFYFIVLAIFILLSCDNLQKLDQILIDSALKIFILYLSLNNLIIYLKNAKNKSLEGVFYNLKISISLLIFALISCAILLFPNIIFIFKLIATSYKNGFFISVLIIILNIFTILLFSYKLIYPTFLRSNIKYFESDINLAKKIDLSSGLSLTGVIILIYNLFSKLF